MTYSVVLERLPLDQGSISPEQGLHTRRQRIYIFPTKPGFVFIGMLFVMLLGAVNYNNSMAYILTFLLASLFMVCMLHTYRNLRGLIISGPHTQSVHAGEPVCFPLLINNRTSLKRIALSIQPYAKKKKNRLKFHHETLTVNIQANQLQREHLIIHSKHRGYLIPGRLRLSSNFPLGLFHAWSYLDLEQTCLIYPKPEGDRQLPFFSQHDSDQQTGTLAGNDDFIGFRQYHPGDPVRSIDWKTLAKEQELQIKRFSGHGANKLRIHWDQCSHLHDVEQRLSQLCLWIIEADKQGLHYSLDIPGTHIDMDYSEKHRIQCLRTLAKYGLVDNKNQD